MKKKTVGTLYTEALQKEPESKSVVEMTEGIFNQEEYLKNILETVDKFKKVTDKDFFVVVELRKERIMQKVLRHQFYARHTCPTPNYDQTVFHYISKTEELKYLWTIPNRYWCHHMLEFANEVPQEEQQSLGHVIDFADGTLFRLAKKLNGEKIDSSELQDFKEKTWHSQIKSEKISPSHLYQKNQSNQKNKTFQIGEKEVPMESFRTTKKTYKKKKKKHPLESNKVLINQ